MHNINDTKKIVSTRTFPKRGKKKIENVCERVFDPLPFVVYNETLQQALGGKLHQFSAVKPEVKFYVNPLKAVDFFRKFCIQWGKYFRLKWRKLYWKL